MSINSMNESLQHSHPIIQINMNDHHKIAHPVFTKFFRMKNSYVSTLSISIS